MKNYDTLSEAVNDLVKRGYVYNFNVTSDCLVCEEHSLLLAPNEFEVDEVHRFEGDTDPGDENILFAISSTKQNVKGLLVNAYGVYSDTISGNLMAKLNIHS